MSSTSFLVYIVPFGVKAAWLSDSLIVGNWNGFSYKLDVSEIVSSSQLLNTSLEAFLSFK